MGFVWRQEQILLPRLFRFMGVYKFVASQGFGLTVFVSFQKLGYERKIRRSQGLDLMSSVFVFRSHAFFTWKYPQVHREVVMPH